MLQKLYKHIRQGTLFPVVMKKLRSENDHKRIQNEINNAFKVSGSKTVERVEVVLKKYFKKPYFKGPGLAEDYIRELAKQIYQRNSRNALSLEKYESLLDSTKHLNASILTTSVWKQLCYLSICNGLFQLGALTRQLAIKSTYLRTESKSANMFDVLEAFKGAVDQRDFEIAKTMLQKMKKLGINKNDLDSYLIYYYLLRGKKEKAYNLAEPYYSIVDHNFKNYLKDKTVAVVGPAPTNTNYGNIIDRYDCVVRTNYRGKKQVLGKEHGSITKVAYYNGMDATDINNLEDRSFLDEPEFVVFKSLKYNYQNDLAKNHKGRKLYSPDKSLIIGTANMIPLIIFDLLHFKPSKIKIFKANFFLSKNAWHKDYKNRPKVVNWWYSFAVHNLITQLNFIKNLWLAGVIEVDEDCMRVLQMTAEEYMRDMEDIYVNSCDAR